MSSPRDSARFEAFVRNELPTVRADANQAELIENALLVGLSINLGLAAYFATRREVVRARTVELVREVKVRIHERVSQFDHRPVRIGPPG